MNSTGSTAFAIRHKEEKERKGKKKEKKREKEDHGDVATRVVGEVKQITDRSPLLLYGVHHGLPAV